MKRFFKSFSYAWRGIVAAFSEQTNLKVEAVCALVVVGAGYYFRITSLEWVAVIFSIGLVLTAELMNTAIELLVNLVSPQRQPLAGKIKDIAAGAVLIASVTAAIIGGIIFIKYMLYL